jgi:hypothetical protein
LKGIDITIHPMEIYVKRLFFTILIIISLSSCYMPFMNDRPEVYPVRVTIYETIHGQPIQQPVYRTSVLVDIHIEYSDGYVRESTKYFSLNVGMNALRTQVYVTNNGPDYIIRSNTLYMEGGNTEDFVLAIYSPAGGTFQLPATGSYTVNWGDGTTESHSGNSSHTYTDAGFYSIGINATSFAMNQGPSGNTPHMIVDVLNWGTVEFTSTQFMFRGAVNLYDFSAFGAPRLNNVSDMSSMFEGAVNFNHSIGNWNVSNVTTMNRVFFGATSFNSNIDSWMVGNVNSMVNMFSGAHIIQPTSQQLGCFKCNRYGFNVQWCLILQSKPQRLEHRQSYIHCIHVSRRHIIQW